MTGRELVSATLRLIGVLAPGESPAASEATDGLSALNRMIGAWSNEGLLVHARVREEFTLTPSDADYSMGSGGNFNTTRPMHIEAVTIENQTASPTTESPVNIIRSSEEWAAVRAKGLTAEIPTHVYIEGTYPTETLNFYPTPTTAHKAVIYSRKPLSSISTLDTSVSLPEGYDEALIYNLAIRLSPEYGKALTDSIHLIAMEGKATIKRTNHRPRYLSCDPALLGGGSFDIMTGGYR